MKTKFNYSQIKNWFDIALYLLILLLFANYESQRKQQPERHKLFVDRQELTRQRITDWRE